MMRIAKVEPGGATEGSIVSLRAVLSEDNTADTTLATLQVEVSEDMEVAEPSTSQYFSNDSDEEEDDNDDEDYFIQIQQSTADKAKEQITERSYTSPDGVTYEVLKKVSSRGHDKLYDSLGYSYTSDKRSRSELTCWRCSVRKKCLNCPATVKERPRGVFTCGRLKHSHPSVPGQYLSDCINAVAKSNAVKYPDKTIAEVVEDAIEQFKPDGDDGPQIPPIDYIKHNASRHRHLVLPNPELRVKSGRIRKHKHKSNNHMQAFITKEKEKKRSRKLKKRAWKSVKSSEVDDDDLVLVYVPRKYFNKILNHGLSSLSDKQQNSTEINELPQIRQTYPIKRSSRPHHKQTPSRSDGPQHNAVNGHVSQPNGETAPQTSQDNNFTAFVSKQTSTPVQHQASPCTVTNQELSRITDPEDMFFHSISAEIKDLPKLAKSRLKLEILSLVNSSLHSNAQ